MRKIFHLEIKSDSSHKYYGSLSALCSENPNLGVSKFTLDRFDFTEPFENGICIIRKSVMKTTGSVGEKKIKNTSANVKSKRSRSNGMEHWLIQAIDMDIELNCNGKKMNLTKKQNQNEKRSN